MNRTRRRILPAALAFFLFGALSATRADTYIVTGTNPSGPGSLAQAITDSNAHTGQDTIVFNIPGTGVHLIDLSQSSLPEITDSVIVDGYTQPGAQPNTLSVGNNAVILIQLDGGSLKSNRRGLVISGSNCIVRGLSITGCQWDPSSDPFFFRVTGGFGIDLLSPGTGNVIQGNFIGLNPDGVTPIANYVGIRIDGPQSVIGGTDPAARNVISGNTSASEITFNGSGTAFRGNYIGTDLTGMKAAGNQTGLKLGANDLVIGGVTPGAGNVISGNQYDGIDFGFSVAYRSYSSANGVLIQGNLIGTTADGTGPLGNGGAAIQIGRGANALIGGLDPGAGNVIAFNTEGVTVLSGGSFGTGDSILSNSIYSNRSHGITLARPESNNGQTFPVVSSATISNSTATLRGTLDSTPSTDFVVQFFADSQSLTTSKQTYLGSIDVVTDDNGHATFRATVPITDSNVVFNATATDSAGNTSEFFRNPAYLQNISTRAAVGSGDNALIGGFVADWGNVAVRGIGPSLKSFGFSNVLADPTLDLRNQAGAQTGFNDNWKDNQSQASQFQAFGLAPAEDAESALLVASFSPNVSYTAVLRGKNETSGLGVVEAYTMLPGDSFNDSGGNTGFANLSSRGLVGSGDNIIVGGFILGEGNESTRVVLRAIGPSLQNAGITNPLPDPVLELHNSSGSVIASDDSWTDTQQNDLQAVGLAPLDERECAILTRLSAGAYTAVVRGKGSATGVALVEIYRLP
jgi:hypothetical protein